MHRLKPAWRQYSYHMLLYRRTWRGTIVVSVANPLLFLTAIGAGLGRLVDQGHGAPGSVPYLTFLAPGLLAAATMQTAVIEAMGPVYEAGGSGGSYRSAAATPMRPDDILHGHLLYMVFRVVSSGAAFIAVMVAFGAARSAPAVLLLPAVALTGLAFAAPMAAFAAWIDLPARLDLCFRFVIMPLYMFSGTFFAVEQLPPWLEPVVYVTPLWHGVELCRSLALGSAGPVPPVVHVVYLAVLACVGVVLARRSYRRRLHY